MPVELPAAPVVARPAARELSEAEVIAGTVAPATTSTLLRDLRALGVRDGDTLIVHSSFSRLGWVVLGPVAVVDALRAAVGKNGTLVMPTHSSDLGEPSYWSMPPVPEAWWPIIRAESPVFDAATTPTRNMGAIVDAFRTVPGALRSAHPRYSFAALGPNARLITEGHELAYGLGEASPLARCYDLEARVLLLGVGHANNTSLHLAEQRASWPSKTTITQGSAQLVDGERAWVTYEEWKENDSDFERIGGDFAASGGQIEGSVGAARALLMSQRELVDFSVKWMTQRRV